MKDTLSATSDVAPPDEAVSAGPDDGEDLATASPTVMMSTPAEIAPAADGFRTEMGELRYAVERLRLREKEGVPAVLGVASVASPDGASSVCRSLAAVLASDPEPTVCLVGLNRWSPDFGGADRPGVAEVVLGTASLGDVLAPTANPRLKYVPLGRVDADGVSVIQRSRGLDDLLSDLRLAFTHVVLELPPILASSEALAFASHCDACAVVVEQGVTPLADLEEALANLGETRLLGVIMNHAETKVPGFLQRLIGG